MYERFTDRVRTVMQLANSEAEARNHRYIARQDILLALIQEENSVAGAVLKNLGVDTEKLRLEIEQLLDQIRERQSESACRELPQAKQTVESAMEAAREMQHRHVGTEHILLGLLQTIDRETAAVLASFGLDYARARDEIRRVLGLSEDAERNV